MPRFHRSMPKRIFFLVWLVFSCHLVLAQKFKRGVHFAVLYDNTLIQRIPFYVERNGFNFAINTNGIHNTSKPMVSLEGGYRIEMKWGMSKKIYSGVSIGYRRAHLSYFDQNLSCLKLSNGEITEISFRADVKQNFVMIQLPLGIVLPLAKNFDLDFAARNNFIVDVSSTESVNDGTFEYKLYTLDRRSASSFILELSTGIRYQWSRYRIGVAYIQGLTSLYPDTKNAHNQIIPSKVYFSSVSFSLDVTLEKLLGQNDK